eukprot:TRINITY_DN9088_c0_g2_i1.p1 TRINITY_DN9088_c0_g2~~TRINITY_DN9088_c0_g2_i1.p1  ORF type:complete len:500 (+),score=129.92 TRINITY_DN9088_c0_g2_i1:180-1679(+)
MISMADGSSTAADPTVNGTLKSSASEATNKVEPKKKRAVDFVFGDILGEGAYSQVQKAVEIETGKEFAAKILDKRFIVKENKVKYVNTEKTILDSLVHPNITRLYCTFQDPESLYFIMELCPNGELRDLIKKAGRFSLTEARFYAAEIINALEYMHSKGVIHRDLKPENVLLDPQMHAKLSDFGTAKVIGTDRLARSHSFTGTAEYVSPELLNDKFSAKCSDLWALGCIIYQMLTGKCPFRGATEYQTFQLISQRKLTIPECVPPVAEDIINKLLELDPEKRLGCGEHGYAELKGHPFFEGVDFASLPRETPPVIEAADALSHSASSVGGAGSFLSDQLGSAGASLDNGSEGEKIQQGLSQLEEGWGPQASSMLFAPHPNAQELMKQWGKFLDLSEKIVHCGMINKRKGLLSNKRRQLILTDQPRLFYVDPEKMVQKGEIRWGDAAALKVSTRNSKRFTITVPTRVYKLEDLSCDAAKWEHAIRQLQSSKKSDRNSLTK